MFLEKYLFPFLRVRKHYSIRLHGVTYIYVYIRKNACSAFLRFLLGESEHAADYSGKGPLAFLRKYHKPTIGDFYKSDSKSIVVLRDPTKRLISLFVNKFVMRSGHEDLFASYKRLTGADPERATFRQFLTDYVQRFPAKKLDRHLLPQIDHLHRTVYTAPVRLDSLYEDMRRVVGDELAQKYFKKPVNASAEKSGEFDSVVDVTANELYTRYSQDEVAPSPSRFECSELVQTIDRVYSRDRRLYSDVCNAYLDIETEGFPTVDIRNY